ncbi:conserved protein of unknown function [Serratia sp. Tan611]|nr:conserved protein of unknown function [Serratia sp. Tan611]
MLATMIITLVVIVGVAVFLAAPAARVKKAEGVGGEKR